jgi:hypothetical protein
VQRAELGIEGLEQARHLVGLADIGLDGDGLAASFSHVGNHGLGGGGVARVVDGHIPAALGCQPCRGGTDAPAGAGDEHVPGHCCNYSAP